MCPVCRMLQHPARDIPPRNVKMKRHDGISLSFNYDVSCQDHTASVMAAQTLHLM